MTSDRQQRQLNAAEIANRIETNLSNAKSLNSPLDRLESLTSFSISPSYSISQDRAESINCNGSTKRNVKVQFYNSPLPDELRNACIDLFRENMSDFYKNSSWGLNVKEKELEFRHDDARFLIVVQDMPIDDDESGCNSHTEENMQEVRGDRKQAQSCEILAFSHFRFEVNDDENPTEEVMYVYEIQVHESVRRCGMGRRLMSIMELLAMQTKMRRVLLTCFKKNEAAMEFYLKKMKYSVDERSPSNYLNDDSDYEILTKVTYKEFKK